jgi:adenosylhomocysteine nucleosidase
VKIGIVAALPGELTPLVRLWKHHKTANGTRVWTHRTNDDVWIAACSGMGADAARRAFAAAEADGDLDIAISLGWAGALIPELQPGDALALSLIIDAQTGERFSLTESPRNLAVVTLTQVAGHQEKLRLRATYPNAAMVDMEAAVIARLAQMRGIPVACIKGVSDGVSSKLPNLNPFVDSMGRLRMGAFLSSIALRPVYWAVLAQLGRDSSKAARAMADLVLKFMEEKNVDRLNRTGVP